MSIAADAKLVFEGDHHEDRAAREACGEHGLISKGCVAAEELVCSDGHKCLKSCNIHHVKIPDGVHVAAYKGSLFEGASCSGKPFAEATGATTMNAKGACAFLVTPRRDNYMSYNCENKSFAHLMARLGLTGPHQNLIIGAIVAIFGLIILLSMKGKPPPTIGRGRGAPTM